MFGIAVASLGSVSDTEKERYQAIYCGLCLELKRIYGQVSRVSLSYDLAFLAMLYASLYEPAERTGKTHCITHPRKKVPFAISPYSAYCADLSVALAYHKCLDDVTDEGTRAAKAARAVLASSYARAEERIPEQCSVIGEALGLIRRIEGEGARQCDPASRADAGATAFGEMLGFLMECCPGCFPDIWSAQLRRLGEGLGRFIYLMDAAVDFRQDLRCGAYNPFVEMAAHEGTGKPDPLAMREMLSVLAGQMADAFERLPLVQDANIMSSVIYAGVWQKFNKEYKHDDSRIFAEDAP